MLGVVVNCSSDANTSEVSSRGSNSTSASKTAYYLNLLKSINSEISPNAITVTSKDSRDFLKFLKSRDFRMTGNEQENSVTLDIISELAKLQPKTALKFLTKQISQHAEIIDKSQICKRKISALIMQLDEQTNGRHREEIIDNTIVYLSKLNIATNSYLAVLKPTLDFIVENIDAKQLFLLTGRIAEHATKGYLSGDLHIRYILSNAAECPKNNSMLNLLQCAYCNDKFFKTTKLEVAITPTKLFFCYLSSITVFEMTCAFIHPMLSVMASIATLFGAMRLLSNRNQIDISSPAVRDFKEFLNKLVLQSDFAVEKGQRKPQAN